MTVSPSQDDLSTAEPTHRPGISDWLGLIRFSHTLFALPFAALATVMAIATPLPNGQFVSVRVQDLLGILICMVAARSAAMAFNRLVDHQIDAENPRTKGTSHSGRDSFSPGCLGFHACL